MKKDVLETAKILEEYKKDLFARTKGLKFVNFEKLPKLLRSFLPNKESYALGELKGIDIAEYHLKEIVNKHKLKE